jgi:hypothetical protein
LTGQVVEGVVGAENRAILQRETQNLIDRYINLHIVYSRERSLIPQIKCVAVVVTVTVFAIKGDMQTACGLDISKYFMQSRQYLLKSHGAG